MKRSYSFFSSSCSSSSKPSKKYDVFLSFRGEDTRNNFTGFLHDRLKEKGIHTFLDDGLQRGKDISDELLETIEESSCSIIVLSTNYANSTWCLKELIKILDCKKTREQIVLPIFFLVEPAHVRKKEGAFGEAFNKLKKDFRDEKEKAQMTENERENMEKDLKRWEDALTEVGKISGFPLTESHNQAKFVDEFVLEVSKKYVGSPPPPEGLFGMRSRMEKLDSYVYRSENGVEFIGICGMGGIGKSTIARTFYELKKLQFEGSSFLGKVKDKKDDLESLVKQLLSDTLKGECTTNAGDISKRLCSKQVLIVIDDVDDWKQLKTLAGEPKWFGSGSRIIITTRDKDLLNAHGVKEIYDVEPLDGQEALQLFTWNAGFKDVYLLPDKYKTLSRHVVEYAHGLPLALEVLGSSLRGKDVDEWTDQLDRLSNNPKTEIIEVLQISFDKLEEREKNIFLVIACFFGGDYDKDYGTSILDKCNYNPRIGIRNLCDKSLLSIKDGRLWVHDLLKEMGLKILGEKSLTNELGRQIKLWNVTNVSHVWKNCTAIEGIEAVFYEDDLSEICPTKKTFLNFLKVLSKMKKLKLLRLFGPLKNDFSVFPVPQYLSNELISLQWHQYPWKCFPSSFQPTQLVEVDMFSSKICRLWDNIKPLPNLRSVLLYFCHDLTEIFDDFTLVPNLEELELSSCVKLLKIDPSINVLGKLTSLDLSYCSSLVNLPPSLNGLESLQILYLQRCSKLRKLPEDIGYLKSLEELDIQDTAITELPSSIVLLENLRKLLFFDRGVRKKIMFNTIFGKGSLPIVLKSLEHLDLSRCNVDAKIPEEIGCFVSLEKLNLSDNNFVSLPASISRLSKLKVLKLRHCSNLLSLTELPSSLQCLYLNHCMQLRSLTELPSSLQVLNLEHCIQLRSLTELPSSLQFVDVSECTSLETFLDPSKQSNLRCSAVCVGCHKLASRQGSERTILTPVERYIRLQNVDPDTSRRLEIVLPGSKIPDWFIHQNIGSSSISIKLYPNWCNSKWMGFALCLCFNLTEPCNYISCDVKLNGQDWGLGTLEYPEVDVIEILDDHLWLLYLPRHTYFCSEWENSCGDQIEFSFKSRDKETIEDINHLQMNICGFRLVYKEDVQEFNSQQAQNNYPIDLNVPPPS